MKYEIYSDESCIEAIYDKQAHQYTAIGGIWIPAEYRNRHKHPVEREVFSAAGNVVTCQRASLKPETVDRLVSLSRKL